MQRGIPFQRKKMVALLIGAGIASGTAYAAAPAAPDKAKDGDKIEEVIVTAQFRQQALQETPISITAVTAAMMEARSQSTVVDVASHAPNVTLTPTGQGFGSSATAAIRGVGQYDFNFALEPGVGMYVDDVYHATLFGSVFELLDLERIEVLRGPQGTLAGKNSIGGAIKLYSKPATGSGDSYMEAGYGSYNKTVFRAGTDFALAPDLFVRLSGMTKHQDGFMKRIDYRCSHPSDTTVPSAGYSGDCKLGTEGGQDVGAMRAAIRWVISPMVENNLIFDVLNDNSEVQPGKLISYPANGNKFVTGSHDYTTYATYTGYPTGTSAIGTPATPFTMPVVNTVHSKGISDTIDFRFSDTLSLKSITAYRKFSGDFASDSDAGPLDAPFTGVTTYNKVWHRQFSQELRLNGTTGPLDWTVGAYYYKGKSFNGGRVDIGEGVLDFNPDDYINTESKSIFGHGTYHLTDNLNLVAGLRHTDDSKDYTFSRRPSAGLTPPLPLVNLDALTGTVGSYSGKRWDYRLGADYKFSPDVLGFIQYSTGYKGGGTNPRPFFPGQSKPFGPETLKAYEMGLKSDLLDQRLRLNASIFYNKYEKIQMTLLTCDINGGTSGPLGVCALPINAGNANVKGLELEAEYHPIAGMTIDASASYLSFKYTDVAAGTGITKDMIAPYTPKKKANLGIQYKIPVGYGTITPRIDWSYRDSFYGNANNAATNKVDALSLANARITWSDPKDEWSLSLAVTNLTDKFYYVNTFDLSASNSGVVGQPGRPREVMVTLGRHF